MFFPRMKRPDMRDFIKRSGIITGKGLRAISYRATRKVEAVTPLNLLLLRLFCLSIVVVCLFFNFSINKTSDLRRVVKD